jgi:transcriptional regulator GlxA family with amidase domain
MLHDALSTTTTNTGQIPDHTYTTISPPPCPHPAGPASPRSQCANAPLLPGTPLSPQEGEVSARGGLAGWQLRKVIRHIDENLGHALPCYDLATVARLSTGHFCRAFKTSVGEPPHAYVIRQRIRRAQSLMLHTEDTLSEIACTCGLTDQAHLTRLFRRIVGSTPKAWRTRWRPRAA